MAQQTDADRAAFREFRLHFELSISEIALAIELSDATLSFWEAGKRDLSEESFTNLRRALIAAAEAKLKKLCDGTGLPPIAADMISTSSNLTEHVVCGPEGEK